MGFLCYRDFALFLKRSQTMAVAMRLPYTRLWVWLQLHSMHFYEGIIMALNTWSAITFWVGCFAKFWPEIWPLYTMKCNTYEVVAEESTSWLEEHLFLWSLSCLSFSQQDILFCFFQLHLLHSIVVVAWLLISFSILEERFWIGFLAFGVPTTNCYYTSVEHIPSTVIHVGAFSIPTLLLLFILHLVLICMNV